MRSIFLYKYAKNDTNILNVWEKNKKTHFLTPIRDYLVIKIVLKNRATSVSLEYYSLSL